jgi:[NiFe] hydrogenase assembly HybE family chaperone
MTEAAVRSSPARALEGTFGAILKRQMHDLPMVNLAVAVEAVGFRPWRDHWLGILITPWFMNLVLMPRVSAMWQPIAERETRHHVFPAGVFEFIGGRDPALGDYQACSLFSPMFEFADHPSARSTAVAALDALFDPDNRAPGGLRTPQLAVVDTPIAAAPVRSISKRDFLFRSAPRAEHEP